MRPSASKGSALKVTIEHGDEKVTVEPDEAVKADAEHEQWDGTGLAGVIVKADATRRYTLAMGYPANSPDVSVALDGHRDFAGPEAVEDAAWQFMKSRKIGLWHEDGTDGAGDVVESYIYRGPDWTVKASDDSERVIKAGDWLLGIVWDEQSWDQIGKQEINGVSMQGKAKRRVPSAESLESLNAR